MELNTIFSEGLWGKSADRINRNFERVGSEVDKMKYAAYNSKLYATEELLRQEQPSPKVGDWAIVGPSIPGEIYRCDEDGVWSATGETGGGYGMEVTEMHVEQNVYTGDFTNAADDEDLVSELDEEGKEVLKLADKAYDAAAFSGMGRVYLRKNLTGGKNVLTQEMMSAANTRYIIQYDYDLNGETVTVPEGCTLDFQGGCIRNGTIDFQTDSSVTGMPLMIDCTVQNVTMEVESEWFGIGSGSDEYNRKALQMLVDAGAKIIVKGTIVLSDAIIVNKTLKIRSESQFAVLQFPNSKGFVFGKTGYSTYNFIENIAIVSNGHCIDFYNEGSSNRPQNVFWSLFRNLQLKSANGCGVYAGSNISAGNNDTMVFNCTFENIRVECAEYGFYGLSGNTTYFKDIKNEGGKAVFCNCSGVIENYNGTWGNVDNFLVIEPFNGSTTYKRYKITLIGCNIESFKKTLLNCGTSYAMCSLAAINCTFYLNHNDSNEIDFFPFNFGILNDLLWTNNLIFRYDNANFDSSHALFRIGFPGSSNTNVVTDTTINYKDNNGVDYTFFSLSKTKKLYINPQLTGNYGKDTPVADFFEAEKAFCSKGYYVRPTVLNLSKSDTNITVGYASCYAIGLSDSSEDVSETTISLNYCQFYGNQLGSLYTFELKNNCSNAKIRLSCNLAYNYGFMNHAGYGGDVYLSPGQSCVCVISMESTHKKIAIVYVHDVTVTYGSSSNRPSDYKRYKMYFDTDLGKPVWWNGTNWVDANGSIV